MIRPSHRLGFLPWFLLLGAALFIVGCALGHSPDLPSGRDDDGGLQGDGDGDGFSTSGDNDIGSGGDTGQRGDGGDCGDGGLGGGTGLEEPAESAEEGGCSR